jgi:hypothetical protein
MWMRSIVLAPALCLTLVTLPADGQVLRGRVSDASSKQLLPAADVVLLDDQEREVTRALTDTMGMFELRAKRSGVHRLQVSLLGYSSLTSDRIELGSRETVQVAVQLSTEAIPVAPIVIVARQRVRGRLEEFEKRRTRWGSGYFITQEEIDRRLTMNASTLVLGVPGVTVYSGYYDRNQIRLPGTGGPCLANLYIDGMRVRGSIDDVLIPAWVGAIEVYPRGAHAPLQYTANGCGVVLFWTREPEGGIRWSWKKIAVGAAFVVGAVLVAR